MPIEDIVSFFSTTFVKEIKRLFKEADTDGSGSPDLRAAGQSIELVNFCQSWLRKSQVVPVQTGRDVKLEKFFSCDWIIFVALRCGLERVSILDHQWNSIERTCKHDTTLLTTDIDKYLDRNGSQRRCLLWAVSSLEDSFDSSPQLRGLRLLNTETQDEASFVESAEGLLVLYFIVA